MIGSTLGSMYDLSPEAVAKLNAMGGGSADADAAQWQADEQAAATKAGLPPVQPLPAQAMTDPIAYTGQNPKTEGTAPNLQLVGGPLGDPGANEKKQGAPLSNEVPVVDAPQARPMSIPSAPAVTTPAHWQNSSREVKVSEGVPVEALAPGMAARGAAFRAGEVAGEKQYQAAALTDAADIDAGRAAAVERNTAALQMRALDAQKQDYIAKEHARLDALNLQAQRQVDPNQAFGSQAGKIMAAIFMAAGQFASMWKGGTNGAMQVVNDAVNRSIEAQKANIANARGAFADRQNLYRDNLAHFGEQRAELATRMQMLDKVAALADARRAGARNAQTDAAHAQFMQALDNDRAKALDDFGKATSAHIDRTMAEKFVAAQTTGGTTKREGNLVTLSDGTTFVMPSEKTADESIKKIQTLDQLQRNNNEILQLRAEAAKLDPILDRTAYNSAIQKLRDLGEQKVALTSLALGQGTVKDEEYKRAQEINVGVTNGLGFFKGNPISAQDRIATEAMLRAQNARWSNDAKSFITAAGGAVYERGYAAGTNGQLKPVGRYTGQDATPTERLAPNGSKAIDGKTEIPTPGPKTADTIPQAPRLDQ